MERFEELGPCYRELRRKIPEILAETKVKPGEVLVDYTGGTKTMSAALVLAGSELFDQFSYVGGEQREKGGFGIVLEGKERTLYQGYPWSELAVREVERARDLWTDCQFESAARLLQKVAPRVPRQKRFEALAELCQGMAARHRLDFPDAVRRLKAAIGRLRPIFEDRPDGPLKLAEDAKSVCEACIVGTATRTFLRELLDNTLRTAAQGRYEDAAARLYRAMEMQGQLWLAEATGGLFANGKCKADKVTNLPQSLQQWLLSQSCNDDGEIRLSLEQLFRALAALDDERARAIAADLALGQRSRWRSATEQRNSSILAHGVKAIGREGFEQMKALATEFLGFDLEDETHPIPPLDVRWFESTRSVPSVGSV